MDDHTPVCGDPQTYTWGPDREGSFAPASGRGMDDTFAEDDVFRTRQTPASMTFDAPLHLPYGTAERTSKDFWGDDVDLYMVEKRPMLPDYAVAENPWDRNPRECGLQRSFQQAEPYMNCHEKEGLWSTGAELARSVDVRVKSLDQFGNFVTTKTEKLGADPIIGNGAGGMGPVLGPHLAPHVRSGVHSDYIGPAGGAMAPARASDPQYNLPAATRSPKLWYSAGTTITGGFVGEAGSLVENPQEGGRPSQIVDFEQPVYVTGGALQPAGDSMVMNDPLGEGRPRMSKEDLDQPIFTASNAQVGSSLLENPQEGGRPGQRIDYGMPVLGTAADHGVGSSLGQNPQQGGRASRKLNFEQITAAGASTGVGSSLSQNPQGGGRPSRFIDFSLFGVSNRPGASTGVGSSLSQNPQGGGRPSRLIDFSLFGVSDRPGASTGVGSSMSQNPQEGGRASQKLNFEWVSPAGSTAGVAGGIGCNDVRGGQRFPRMEIVPDRANGAGGIQYYGGDIAFGKEIPVRFRRTEEANMLIPGASGRGTIVSPGSWTAKGNTVQNESTTFFDDSPDPILQMAARKTLGAQSLLDFSRLNLDDLSISVAC